MAVAVAGCTVVHRDPTPDDLRARGVKLSADRRLVEYTPPATSAFAGYEVRLDRDGSVQLRPVGVAGEAGVP